MDIFHIERKGPLLNTLEQFHIHNLSTKKLKMNNTDTHNPIFDLIVKYDPHNNKPLTNPTSPPPPDKMAKKPTSPPFPLTNI
jgi:hypothetical protein